MEGAEARVIENLEGERTTPSVVAVPEDGYKHVGNTAKKGLLVHSKNTFNATKLLIGRKFDESLAKELKVNYDIIEGPGGLAAMKDARGAVFTPANIATTILSFLKETAESHIGGKVDSAVIGVPPSFTDEQRKVVIEAASQAGLKVRSLVAEPIAAALAYKLNETSRGKYVAVYDLGGRTFEFSILKVSMTGGLETVANFRTAELGGFDIDLLLFNWLMDEFFKKHNIDISKDNVARQRILDTCERVKMELSTSLTSDINLPYLSADATGPKHLETALPRGKLETMVLPMLQKSLELCGETLGKAGLTVADLDQIVLSGGLTRMPKLRELAQEYFKKEPLKAINPDELIAIGAAYHGTTTTASGADTKMETVFATLPLDISVASRGGFAHVVLKAGTPLPARATVVVTTVDDNQTNAEIKVFMGQRVMAEENFEIGKLSLSKLSLSARAEPVIELAVVVDDDGLIEMVAVDLGSRGVEVYAESTILMKLTPEDALRHVEEAAEYFDAEIRRQERFQKLRPLLENLFDLRRLLFAYREAISSDTLSELDTEIQKLIKKVDSLEENGLSEEVSALATLISSTVSKGVAKKRAEL